MEDEEVEKPAEGNPKGGSTVGEKENPRTVLPEFDPNLAYKEPVNREQKWLNTLGTAAFETKSASSISGTNFSISAIGKDLYTPVDLAKGIPDQYEREKFISDHNNRLVQLLDPDKYGIRFNREIADYAAFKERNYKTETKKFLDELDENQGFLDAAWRTGAKAIGNFALNVGGLVPLVYGLGAGLFTWDSKNIFNNTMFDAWDYMQEGLDKHLVVYGGSEYYYDANGKKKNFFSRFVDNPMKSLNADVVPAVAFVAGAVATELIAAAAAPVTGGTSLIGNTARLGAQATRMFGRSVKVLRGLDQVSDFENMRKIASLTQKYKAGLGTATAMVRTAGYESSLIARSTYDTTLSKAKENYLNSKKAELLDAGYSEDEIGRLLEDPNFIPRSEVAKMEKAAEDASELAWFTNIPLVGFSNMVQFSKVFASGYKINKAIARANPLSLKGVVRQGGQYTAKIETMGTARKLAGYGVVGLKNGLVEGFEEYAQGVIEQGYSDYWSSRFSEGSVKQSVEFMDAMTKAARNYGGSVEGFDSMTIGFLMGMVGVRLPVKYDAKTGKLTRGWEAYGGVRQEFKELKKQIEADKARAKNLNEAAPINPMLKAQFENLSRNFAIQEDMEKALKEGDLFTYKNKEYEQFHSYVATRYKMDAHDTIFQDLDEFEKLDLAEFNKQFATPEIHEFTEESRKAALDKAREAAKNIIDAHDHVNDAFNDTRMAADFMRKNYQGVIDPLQLMEGIKEQMTFLYGATLNQTKREKDLEGQVRELTQGKISPGIVNQILSEITDVSKEGQLGLITQAKETYKAAMQEWKETDPTSYNLYHKQVAPLLEDLLKIKEYKSKISKMYDTLFTKKGSEQFIGIYEQLMKNAAQLAQEEAIKKKEEEQKNTRSSNKSSKTNADLRSLGAEDKVDERLAAEAKFADQFLDEFITEADPSGASTTDLNELKSNVDADTIIRTLQRTPALFKAILERLEKQNKLIPGLNNIDQLPEILAEDPMAGAKIAGAMQEILQEIRDSKPAEVPVLNYADPEDSTQPAPTVEAGTSLAETYNLKNEELKSQGIYQPGTNVTEVSIIPITHDKLIDQTTGQVVRNNETGKFEVWTGPTGLKTDHPVDNAKLNSPDFLNNKELTEENKEATFRIADNEWNETAREANDIAIDVYHGDTFIGRLPAWREGMPVHLLALRQAIVAQETGAAVAEELGETTETKEELEAQIEARKNKLIEELGNIQSYFNNLTGVKKLTNTAKLEPALQEARDKATADIKALEDKIANLSTTPTSDIKAKIADIEKRRTESIVSFIKSRPRVKLSSNEEIAKAKEELNKQTTEINDQYDAEYLEAVKKGEIPKDTAMRAISSADGLNRKAYAELAALKGTATSNIDTKKIEGTNARGTTYKGETTEKDGLKVTKYSEFSPDGKRITKGGRIMTPAEFIEEYAITDQDHLENLEGATEIRVYEVKVGKNGKSGIDIKVSYPDLDLEITVGGQESTALESSTPTSDIEAKKAEIEKNVPDRANILNAAYRAQEFFPNETREELEKRLQEEIDHINLLVKKLKEKGIPNEKIIKQIKDYISNGSRVISRREGLSDFVTYLVENNTRISTDAELASLESTSTTSEIESKKAEALAAAQEVNDIIQSEEVSKTIDEFSNTNLDRQGKEDLLQDTIKNLIDNWITDEMSFVEISEMVADFMKTEGTTLIKAVWRNNKKDFYNLLSAWQKGKKLKAELATLREAAKNKLPQTTTMRRGIIDNNFDAIIEQLTASKINVFFNNNNQFKQC